MIDALIGEGSDLYNRVRVQLERGTSNVPSSQKVLVSEVEAWYTGAGLAIAQQFGSSSPETLAWTSGLERMRNFAHENVGRIRPTDGSWVLYNLTESIGILHSVRLLALRHPKRSSDIARAVNALIGECDGQTINAAYAEDFGATLRETGICFEQECYIATLALCGKLLEIALKQMFLDYGVTFGDKATLGQLIALANEKRVLQQVNPALNEIATLINRNRVPAVHAKEHVPVPSRDQASMAIHATIDTIRKTLIKGKPI